MASIQRINQAASLLLRHAQPRCLSPCLSTRIAPRRSPLAPALRQSFSSYPALYADIIIHVPQMAESISEGTLSTFLKQVGDQIEADDEVASIETDKIDVAVTSPEPGVLRELFAEEGDVVKVGQPIARVETGVTSKTELTQKQSEPESKPEPKASSPAPQTSEKSSASQTPPPQPPKAPSQAATTTTQSSTQPQQAPSPSYASESPQTKPHRFEREEKMSRMRKTIATRLKESQNNCASLTTMQEIDMSALMAWRAKYKEEVAETHGVRLGYMGAFTKATTMAAQQVPQINASIDMEREMITYRDYVDVSIAVSSPKGLITPVVRNAEAASIVELEREIAMLAKKARESKLTMDDLQGGNYSISNPGIFGSMFGTPLINYPQAAVFNMNSIKERPVVVDGKIEIRPMMYITVTYDHRLIDGREAVGFLNLVKKYIEDPSRMLLA